MAKACSRGYSWPVLYAVMSQFRIFFYCPRFCLWRCSFGSPITPFPQVPTNLFFLDFFSLRWLKNLLDRDVWGELQVFLKYTQLIAQHSPKTLVHGWVSRVCRCSFCFVFLKVWCIFFNLNKGFPTSKVWCLRILWVFIMVVMWLFVFRTLVEYSMPSSKLVFRYCSSLFFLWT